MGSRKLILLSLLAFPLSLGAETASDYVARGAQKYIFGREEAAKAEIDTGLAKFPNDPELREMLALFKKKPPQEQKDENKKNEDKNKNDQDQSEQNQNQKPSPTPTPSEDKQQSGPEESATPTPTPGSSPSEGESPSPSPTPGDMPSPTPSPGDDQDGNGAGNNGEEPSPNPSATPSKPLTGEVKGAGEEKPQGTPAGEIAEAEPEKEGEMSPKQAAALLESMKDEEQKVQLDEHRRAAPVYKDW
jgi:hypothetical protein